MTITNDDIVRVWDTLRLRIHEVFEGDSVTLYLLLPSQSDDGIARVIAVTDNGLDRPHPILNLFPDGGALGMRKRDIYETLRTMNTVISFLQARKRIV